MGPTGTTRSGTRVDDLLVRAGRGNVSAFTDLYDATAARVFGLARAIVVDPSRAEDVSQDAYLDVWRQAPRYDPALSPAISWMFRITHARAVDHIRGSERTRRNDNAAAQTLGGSSDYDQVLEAVLAREKPSPHLYVALAGLTALQRQAIRLTYWDKLTGPEASRMLGIPLPTFKARLRDALLALRAADVEPGRGTCAPSPALCP